MATVTGATACRGAAVPTDSHAATVAPPNSSTIHHAGRNDAAPPCLRYPCLLGTPSPRLVARGVNVETLLEYMKQCAGIVKCRVAVTIAPQCATGPTALGGTIPAGELL